VAKRFFDGNHPDEDSGWIRIGQIKREEFDLSVYTKGWSNGWKSIKLVSNKRTPNKANYWLGWDGNRFANSGDYRKMVEHKDWAESMLVEILVSDAG
jgi:hypothetical protein